MARGYFSIIAYRLVESPWHERQELSKLLSLQAWCHLPHCWPKDLRGQHRDEAVLLLPEALLCAVHRATGNILANAAGRRQGAHPRCLVGFIQQEYCLSAADEYLFPAAWALYLPYPGWVLWNYLPWPNWTLPILQCGFYFCRFFNPT